AALSSSRIAKPSFGETEKQRGERELQEGQAFFATCGLDVSRPFSRGSSGRGRPFGLLAKAPRAHTPPAQGLSGSRLSCAVSLSAGWSWEESTGKPPLGATLGAPSTRCTTAPPLGATLRRCYSNPLLGRMMDQDRTLYGGFFAGRAFAAPKLTQIEPHW
ncbi:Succinate dehydrogenase [ubiquinone] flavoprotein subunit, partial [Durusdinium trenchii]